MDEDTRGSELMAGTGSAKAKYAPKRKSAVKRGFSIFQVVTGVVGVGLVVLLAFHLTPPLASLLVSASIVGGTYALHAMGRI